ncbi:MAG TPA: ABC transporter ATP-binding protein [Solirubrobacteraceae bacterium]|nr:ABC transporter ATP-binding protein [Solirubrobacteraceae bacterium]
MSVLLAGVRHRYGGGGRRDGVEALGPVDLEIAPGELVAIVGPSGCGKSTLLSLIAGFVRPSSGTVSVEGVEVREPGPDRGVVFQHPNLYPWLTVRDNVAFGPRMKGVAKSARRAAADAQLAAVGLSEFADARPYELSGGMQQRCQIARMLAGEPRIMLLDEPFGALDALTREQMQGELHRIWEGSGRTAVLVTHSVEEAVFLGTRVLVMSPRPGRVVFDEPVPLAGEPRTRALRTAPEFVEFRERVAAQLHHDVDGARMGEAAALR